MWRKNVATQLSENLSAYYFNGIQSTPMYLNRGHMMKETSDKVNGIFDFHSCFLRKLHRICLLTLFTWMAFALRSRPPKPRNRQRLTRIRAASLQDDGGKSLQYDVESSSSNRQAVYLLVPKHNVNEATTALKKYMERHTNLHPSTVLNCTLSETVITNVDFLRNMTQSTLCQTF